MSINSDEVNYLVYRYLQESGFLHAAFTFAHESLVARSVAADSEVPAGALLSFLQKGLQYVEVEAHLAEDGSERQCDEPFHLLAPHVCRVRALTGKGAAAAGAAAGADAAGDGAGAPPPGTELPPSDVTVLGGHTSEASAVAWNPKSDVLASGAADATARIWRTADGRGSDTPSSVLRHVAPAGGEVKSKKERSDVAALEWSPDGARLATACSDGRARVWAADGSLVATLSAHTAPISTTRWSPSGQLLLTAGCA
jgi:transducin (beta)-like 1